MEDGHHTRWKMEDRQHRRWKREDHHHTRWKMEERRWEMITIGDGRGKIEDGQESSQDGGVPWIELILSQDARSEPPDLEAISRSRHMLKNCPR
jgi:hypothetical protein